MWGPPRVVTPFRCVWYGEGDAQRLIILFILLIGVVFAVFYLLPQIYLSVRCRVALCRQNTSIFEILITRKMIKKPSETYGKNLFNADKDQCVCVCVKSI